MTDWLAGWLLDVMRQASASAEGREEGRKRERKLGGRGLKSGFSQGMGKLSRRLVSGLGMLRVPRAAEVKGSIWS